jgi:S1-C subfamily serine protease
MTLRWRSKISAAALFVLLFSCVGKGQGVFEQIGQEVNGIFEKARPAVVKVRALNDGIQVTGTGFFIDNRGTLLTASLILGRSNTSPDGSRVEVEYNGQKLEARIIGNDIRSGVALLQVPLTATPHLVLAEVPDPKIGSSVISIGYPFDLPVAPTFGMVSGLDSRYQNRFFATTHIRANIPISPGQVGGPLLNTKGQVLGVLVTAVEEGKACYVLPSAAVLKVADEIRQVGVPRHGWIGVEVTETAASASDGRNIKILQLKPNTPAAQSGLRPGDVVLKIGRREIYRPADVIDASFFSRVGQELDVTVLRDGKPQTFKFVVGERPSSAPVVAPAGQSSMPQGLPTAPNPNEPQTVKVKGS